MYEPLLRKFLTKKYLISTLTVVLVIVSVVLVVGGSRKNIDVLPTADDSLKVDYSKSVAFVNGEELFKKMSGFETYDRLRLDMYLFGKRAYEPYSSGRVKYIGFEVNTKSIKRDGQVITFTGKYGSSNNKIVVTVKLLNNFMINTSITDTKTKQNFDIDLPSNTKADQFIGTLPYKTEIYTVAYSEIQGKVVVRLVSNSPNDQKEALEYIRKAVGNYFINDSTIDILYPVMSDTDSKAEYVRSYIGEEYRY